MFKERSQLFPLGFSEGKSISQGHLPLIQVVLVLGLRLDIGGISITDIVEHIMGGFPEGWKDLESCSSRPPA